MFHLRRHSQSYPSFVFVYCVGFFLANYYENAIAQEFAYPGQANSERDLSTCRPYEICSVVHKRYWFTTRVDRLCRCDSSECPSGWSETSDDQYHNYTMTLNNRSQMKFCEPVTALPNCFATSDPISSNSVPAEVTTTTTTAATNTARTRQRFLHVVNETRTEIVNNATVTNYKLSSRAECFCPSSPPNIWIPHAFQKNQSTSGAGVTVASTWTSYRCSELPKCKTGDMCGFERTDFFSNYYKCSCPYGHLCLRQNHSAIRQVNEMLYEGPAFVTNCQKKKSKREAYVTNVGVAEASAHSPITP